jgi:Anti-sigma factor NepR
MGRHSFRRKRLFGHSRRQSKFGSGYWPGPVAHRFKMEPTSQHLVSSLCPNLCHAWRLLSNTARYVMTSHLKRGFVAVALGKATKSLPDAGRRPGTKAEPRDESDIGIALRAAYKSALDETIPAEMLDLLSKLK